MIDTTKDHWPEDNHFEDYNRFKSQKGSGQKHGYVDRNFESEQYGSGQQSEKDRPGVVRRPTYAKQGAHKDLKLNENEAYEPGVGKYTLSNRELERYTDFQNGNDRESSQ